MGATAQLPAIIRSAVISILLVPQMVLSQSPAARPVRKGNLFELRIARHTPAPHYVLTKSVTDSTFYVQNRVIIADADIRAARTAPSTDGVALTVHLTSDGATRFNQAVRAHVGERVAVFIQGRLNNAPVIARGMQVTAAQPLTIAVHLPSADAQQFAAAVAARWP
jgi:preprotein translocase subunit SecD